MRACALRSKGGNGIFVFNHHSSCGRRSVISRSSQYIQSNWHSMQREIKTCLTSVLWVVFNLNKLLLSSGPWVVRSGRKNKSTQQISRKQHICKLLHFPVICAETTFSEGWLFLLSQCAHSGDWLFVFVLFLSKPDCCHFYWEEWLQIFRRIWRRRMLPPLATWWRTLPWGYQSVPSTDLCLGRCRLFPSHLFVTISVWTRRSLLSLVLNLKVWPRKVLSSIILCKFSFSLVKMLFKVLIKFGSRACECMALRHTVRIRLVCQSRADRKICLGPLHSHCCFTLFCDLI